MKIKCVCLNLWIGGELFDEIVKFLRHEKPDIVLLQEVYNSQLFSLKPQYHSFFTLSEELDFPHAAFAPTFIETVHEHEIEQGNAIFSRFPITPNQTIFYDVPFGKRINTPEAFSQTPRSLQHVTIHLPKTDLHAFNTQGIWGKDGDDSDRRLAMADTIIDALTTVPSGVPKILAGDFNVRAETKTMQKIEAVLTNLFHNELTTTFNMRRKNNPGFANAVVDMFFTSPDIRSTNHYCPKVDISDHLPLVVELEI